MQPYRTHKLVITWEHIDAYVYHARALGHVPIIIGTPTLWILQMLETYKKSTLHSHAHQTIERKHTAYAIHSIEIPRMSTQTCSSPPPKRGCRPCTLVGLSLITVRMFCFDNCRANPFVNQGEQSLKRTKPRLESHVHQIKRRAILANAVGERDI